MGGPVDAPAPVGPELKLKRSRLWGPHVGAGPSPDAIRVDALVTDVHTGSSLAGVRDLGRARLRVLSLANDRAACGGWSRYATFSATAPDSDQDPRGFVSRVASLAAAHGPFVFYPSGEPAIHAVLEHGSDLPPSAVLPFARLNSLRALRDKRELTRLAASVGLATPATIMEAPAAVIAAAPPPLPFAVKQVLPEGSLKKRTRIIETRAELDELLEVVPADEPLLIQERAEGPLIGLALVLDTEGRLVARFQQFARRLWPVEAGGSTLAVSMAPDEDLVSRSARMLADSGFSGLAQLQFLRTARGPALIDVNPRFYGSMALASASGVNLGHIWHRVVTGEPSRPVPQYRAGVSYRWLEGDLTAALNGSPERLFARTPRPKTGQAWAPDDPVPGVIVAGRAIEARARQRVVGAVSALRALRS